jgi:hypothetical protein
VCYLVAPEKVIFLGQYSVKRDSLEIFDS